MRGRFITILGFLVAIALIFSLASAYVRPNAHDLLSLFGLLFPYVYMSGLVILPFLWRANRITFIGLLLLIIWGMPGFFSYVKPTLGDQTAASADINIMTFNAMMGVKLVDQRHVFSPARQELFKDLIRRHPSPDIVCMQEVKDMVFEAIEAVSEWPYSHRLDKRGAIILSQYPIVNRGLVDFGARLNSCLWADIDIHGTIIRVYSLHLESNRLNQSSYEFLAKEGKYESQEAIKGIQDLLTKYPKYATDRAIQAEQVKRHIATSPYPVILCGDFNDPPMSYTYNVLSANLHDTFLKNGSGWGTTWTGAIPLLRIDYILFSPELTNTSFNCLKSDLSDHYPIKASFDIHAKK